MGHKLLVLMLSLLAGMPQRLCTCAAASVPCANSTCPPLSPTDPRAERCGCHEHGGDATADDDEQVDDRPGHSPAPPHRHPERHDDDCPAVKPAPDWQAAESVSFEYPSPVSTALVNDSPLVCPTDRSTPHTLAEQPPGRLPVYLSTLRLRI